MYTHVLRVEVYSDTVYGTIIKEYETDLPCPRKNNTCTTYYYKRETLIVTNVMNYLTLLIKSMYMVELSQIILVATPTLCIPSSSTTHQPFRDLALPRHRKYRPSAQRDPPNGRKPLRPGQW